MKLIKYYIITGLIALIVSPILATIGSIGFMIGTPIFFILFWTIYAKKAAVPDKAFEIFLPLFLGFCYYGIIWIISFGLSDYRLSDSHLFRVFFILTLPYIILNVILSLADAMNVFPFTNIAVLIISALTIIITRAISKKKIIFDKRTLIYAGVFICLLGVSVFQIYDRSTRILNADASTERVKDEVDVNNYRPFLNGINDRLKRLNKPSSVSFTENYPRLDGATAAYPVYAAMVQELYTGLDETTVREYVTCSRTDEAYLRLIKGEIDILFGAEPSKGQREKARARGRKLVLTPIAKEAFVFFVNKDNPVDSLTLSQIQDIYQKKITNWKTVGGNHEKIMPFQRPENSGSQTIMLSLLMKDKILPAPLEEEKADRMNRIINEVAEYRNYSSAIGYSFRYFATEMNPNDNIKLLTIDGVEPSAANIRNGTYPFTLDVYAVTTDFTADENAEKLIEWILSEQGQDFIELCGYVRR